METPIGTAFVTVNDTAGGEPFEVFVQVGKAGSDTMAVAEALGRLVSLVLRLPSPLSAGRRAGGGHQPAFADRRGPADRLRPREGALVARCAGPGAGRAHRPGRRPARGRGAGAPAIGDLCKECGQATLIYEEGCKKCVSCGYNEC